MRLESRLRTLSRRIGPRPPNDIIVHWVNCIFSMKGHWEIGFDENNQPYSKGNVPPGYTHDMIGKPLKKQNAQTEPRE